jgi:site-specific DNA-methyltransferase (adenine-specific)
MHAGNFTTILLGDAKTRGEELPPESVHAIVTSVPYWRLRDYKVDGQLGREATPREYVEATVAALRPYRAALRRDGLLWLNIDDTYAPNWSSRREMAARPWTAPRSREKGRDCGLRAKELALIPERLAIGMQEDGWLPRRRLQWVKPNPKPESARDRPTCSHEPVYLFARRSRPYFYDWFGVREKGTSGAADVKKQLEAKDRPAVVAGEVREGIDEHVAYSPESSKIGRKKSVGAVGFRNLRDVWTIGERRYKGAHFATFPLELARRAIKASTSPAGVCAKCGAPRFRVTKNMTRRGDNNGAREHEDERGRDTSGVLGNRKFYEEYVEPVHVGWRASCKCGDAVGTRPAVVLDPFGGSGTVAVAAMQLGRDAILVELSRRYVSLIETRLEENFGAMRLVYGWETLRKAEPADSSELFSRS